MHTSRVLELELPEDLDVNAYDAVLEFAVILANPNDHSVPWKTSVWFGFTASWLGWGMRIRASAEYDKEFASQLAHGTSPAREHQYSQERAFFGCISSALSALECFYLATYCLGAAIDQTAFPLSKAGHLNKYPHDVAEAFARFESSNPFASTLASVVDSPEYRGLSDLRNALAHRGVLPRQVHLSTVSAIAATIPSNPKALAVDFVPDAPLESESTAKHVRWATSALSRLTADFAAFLQAKVPR
jgi:hypothetical protein